MFYDSDWDDFCAFCDGMDALEEELEAWGEQQRRDLDAWRDEMEAEYEWMPPVEEPEEFDPYVSSPYYTVERVALVNGVEVPYEKLWMYEDNPNFEIEVFGV